MARSVMQGKKCNCRPALRHRDCSYCGIGWDDGRVCGKCREAGVAGSVIIGSEARVCTYHRQLILRGGADR